MRLRHSATVRAAADPASPIMANESGRRSSRVRAAMARAAAAPHGAGPRRVRISGHGPGPPAEAGTDADGGEDTEGQGER